VVSADVNESPDPLPDSAVFVKCDVRSWSSVLDLFAVAKQMFGRVDIVCANAGIGDKENTVADNLEEPNWDVVDVNLKGVLMTVKVALYYFRRNDPQGGVIVVTGSITSFMPSHHGIYLYTCTKYGLLGLLRSLRRYVPEIHCRINMVAPYLTRTGLAKRRDPNSTFTIGQPINDPPAVAQAHAMLAADESINGKAVIAIGEKYYETEDIREELLDQEVSREVHELWSRALSTNPFLHAERN